MALRLRRGTDAERLTIIPVEGELIYTTDQQELWIGDGSTVGGNKIGGIIPQFLTDLNDVVAENPQIGQVLKWDGSNWIASADNNSGVVENSNYKINIVGTDSSIIVNSSTDTFTGNFVGDIKGSVFNDSNIKIVDGVSNTFTGTFVGDGSQLTNLPIANDGSGIIEGSNYRINIIGSDSTLIVDTFSNTFTGNFVGDGSGLVNLPDNGITEGDTYQFNIVGSDSTLIVDTFNNIVTGNFVGDGSGLVNLPDGVIEGESYQINIIGSDSTLIVDTFSNKVNSNIGSFNLLEIKDNVLTLDSFDTLNTNSQSLRIVSNDSISPLKLVRQSESDISSEDLEYGAIYFEREDPISGNYSPCAITGRIDGLAFVADNTGEFLEFKTLKLTDFGDLGLGTYTPTAKLDVRGNAVFEGDVQAAAFKGSIVGDDSSTIIDAIKGTITAQGFIQFGSYSDEEIAAITPVNGMVYYNSTSNKFRGYQGGAWINLDGTTI